VADGQQNDNFKAGNSIRRHLEAISAEETVAPLLLGAFTRVAEL
jgi:hypothetical protein